MTTERVVPQYDETTNPILDDFKERRQRFGRPLPNYNTHIEFPVLHHSDESPLPCRESVEELEAVALTYSTQVKGLFNALATCHTLDAEAAGELRPYLRSDGIALEIMTGQQLIDEAPPCQHRLYYSTRLTLKDPDALPQVSFVTKLKLRSATSSGAWTHIADVRPLALRVLFELLVHLPAIQELECPWLWEHMPIAFPAEPIRHYTRQWEGPWRDARHDFGRAAEEFNDTVPASMTKACLWFYKSERAGEDQSVQMPNLVHPATVDPLSVGLRTLASHLEELDVRAFLVPEMLDTQTSWPRMKRLRIEFHPLRPDGSWYFVGPRQEDPNPQGFEVKDEHYPPTTTTEEDERMDDKYADFEEEWYEESERRHDMFRTEPSADKIESLLTAFAQKLKATTSIEEAELFTILKWYPSEERESSYEDEPPYEEGAHRWGVKYTAAKDGSKALLNWQVGDWRPPGNIIELFEALGGDEGVEVTWQPFEFKD